MKKVIISISTVSVIIMLIAIILTTNNIYNYNKNISSYNQIVNEIDFYSPDIDCKYSILGMQLGDDNLITYDNKLYSVICKTSETYQISVKGAYNSYTLGNWINLCSTNEYADIRNIGNIPLDSNYQLIYKDNDLNLINVNFSNEIFTGTDGEIMTKVYGTDITNVVVLFNTESYNLYNRFTDTIVFLNYNKSEIQELLHKEYKDYLPAVLFIVVVTVLMYILAIIIYLTIIGY